MIFPSSVASYWKGLLSYCERLERYLGRKQRFKRDCSLSWLPRKLYHFICEGRSSDRPDYPLVWPESWTGALEGSSPLALFLQCAFACLPCSLLPEASQGHSLEWIMWWWWDYLDCVPDWTQLRLLYRFLRFWQASVEIYLSCGHKRQDSKVKFPCFLNLPPTNLE